MNLEDHSELVWEGDRCYTSDGILIGYRKSLEPMVQNAEDAIRLAESVCNSTLDATLMEIDTEARKGNYSTFLHAIGLESTKALIPLLEARGFECYFREESPPEKTSLSINWYPKSVTTENL
jgi:hypothetical protein